MIAGQLLERARQDFQAGRLQDASLTCHETLRADPMNAEAAYLLGMIALHENKQASAAEWLGRAIKYAPGVPEYHANLAHPLRTMGKLDEAGAALERAISLRPDYTMAINNLGALRRAQGRPEDALACYRKALEIAPDFVPGHLNLGNALKDMGRLADAAETYARAIELAPTNADAHALLAGALESIGDVDGAIKSYEAALRQNPANVLALINYAGLLKRLGRLDESMQLLQCAQRANPRTPDVLEKLARGLFDGGYYEDGQKYFEQALRLRPTPQVQVAIATLVPPIYKSLPEVQTWRQRLAWQVSALLKRGVRIDITEQPARSPFYIPYAGLDDSDVMRDIAGLHLPPRDRPLKPSRGGKMRVGFISTLFKEHTVGFWMQGLIAQLSREKFEVVVLSAAHHDDSVARFIRQHADEYHDVPDALPSARQMIIDANLDALIYADLGMEGFTWSLAFSRLAPVQCVMWGHPVTSGVPAVDYYISGELAEAEDAAKNYTEKLAKLPNLPLYYYRPASPSVSRDRAHFNLPADAHVYGCLQVTFKLHPEFDFVIGEILHRDPHGLLLVPQSGLSHWDKMVLDRIGKSYPDVVERIRFIPRMSRDEFRSLNALCDVMLAPFPFGAGDTSMEAFALGVPVVTMPTPYLKGRFTHAMYRAMNVMDCVADSPKGYIDIVIRLASDPSWRREISEKILAANHALYENAAGVRDLEQFLMNLRHATSVRA